MKEDKSRDGDDGGGNRSTTSSASVIAAGPGGGYQLKFLILLLVLCGIYNTGSNSLKFGRNVFVDSQATSGSGSDRQLQDTDADIIASAPSLTSDEEKLCEDRFRSILPIIGDDDGLYQPAATRSPVPVVIHRNGEATSCGEVDIYTVLKELKTNYAAEGCPIPLDKYQFESLLTKTLNGALATSGNNACHSMEVYGDKNQGLLGYCDMGEDHTPILLDHKDLVPVKSKSGQSQSLPCHFHTREGLRITQSQQISEIMMTLFEDDREKSDDDCQGDEKTQTCVSSSQNNNNEGNRKEIHLYAVPAGRVFMFAPTYVGEIFHLPHVPGASDKPIYLEVMSLKPRVFDVFNFFNREESKELVDKAMAEKSELYRIKRSTTGASDKSVNSRRTSESGFDTTGKTAIKIKRRCFDALGFDEYIESHSDGLQILRYNVSKAYNSHLDWIEDTTGQLKHDYDSGGTGGNRFATILLYMSDLGEDDGGETVFPHGIPTNIPEEQRLTKQEARDQLRASDRGNVLRNGSWEEELLGLCRSQLAVRPHSSRAVLFYSQHPNGEVDKSSLHGACPVLSNQKYAANLWVWNTPRTGFHGAPIKKKFQKEMGGTKTTVSHTNMKISGKFVNSGNDETMDNAELFYEDTFWGRLGKGDPELSVNTYQGHTWNVKVNGKTVTTWVISEKKGAFQKMVI